MKRIREFENIELSFRFREKMFKMFIFQISFNKCYGEFKMKNYNQYRPPWREKNFVAKQEKKYNNSGKV